MQIKVMMRHSPSPPHTQIRRGKEEEEEEKEEEGGGRRRRKQDAKDIEKMEPLHIGGGTVKWCSHKGQTLYDLTFIKVLRAVKFREKVALGLPGTERGLGS